jgi:hypothetical protein
MVTELRHYVAADGKADAMHKVMKEDVLPIFKRLKFRITDYWVQDGDAQHVWYVMAWDSKQAVQDGWAKFRADAEWLRVKEANGTVFGKVESFVLNDVPGMKI